MKKAQLFLITLFCAVSVLNFAGAEKVEQGHRDSHHEKDYFHYRAKRYTRGRVPVSYMYSRLNDDDNYALEKRYRSDTIPVNPAASHFRELQVRQTKRPSPPGIEYLSSPHMKSYRNLLQYSGRNGNSGIGDDMEIPEMVEEQQRLPQTAGGMGPLSDEELQSLLLLLEEYQQEKSVPVRNFYSPPPQYFTPSMEFAGVEKRETGKRTSGNRGSLVLEQPMSFENSVGGDNYPVFLNQKRSKRVGNPSSKLTVSNTRIKKETDPKVAAELDKAFGSASTAGNQKEDHPSHHSAAVPTTSIVSSNQIPSPSHSNKKPKKAIDWSDYFGIDKRQDDPNKKQKEAINLDQQSLSPKANQQAVSENDASEEHSDKTTSISSSTASSTTAIDGAKRDSETSKDKSKKAKDKTEDPNRQENDAKEKSDQQWILKEFYKHLAMSTNNKKKRESPIPNTSNDLDKLEKIEQNMEEAGDQLIWDTLKYTGAHKGEELSPEELAHVKSQVIQKLSAAYSLEKVREAIEDFRQKLEQLKDKQQYY